MMLTSSMMTLADLMIGPTSAPQQPRKKSALHVKSSSAKKAKSQRIARKRTRKSAK
jgi:hypothetical protein